MRVKDLWYYVAGFVMGVMLTVTIAAWSEASVAHKVTFVALLVLLSLATWSKRKSQNSNNSPNNRPREVLECEPRDKGNGSTDKGYYKGDTPLLVHSEPPVRNVP